MGDVPNRADRDQHVSSIGDMVGCFVGAGDVMNEDKQRIQELEAQIQDLHNVLWMHVEVGAKSSLLIAELSRHRKPRVEDDDGKYLDLLVRSRGALVICEDAIKRYPNETVMGLDVLLDDLASSIDDWSLRVDKRERV
jgi:hypothetical protein